MKKGFILPIIIIGIVSIIIVGGAGYFVGKNYTIQKKQQDQSSTPTVVQVNPKLTPTAINPQPLFSGKLQRLNQNLGLFAVTETDKLNGTENNAVYYDAGTFTRGKYKDYKCIIGVKPPAGPSFPIVYFFATKDFSSYVLNYDNKTEAGLEDAYLYVDKNKISSTDLLDSDLPEILELNQQFSLFRDDIPTNNVETSQIDKNGYKIYEDQIDTNFSSYFSIQSPFPNLTLYTKPREKNQYISQMTSEEQKNEAIRDQYITGTNEVIAVDSTGLPYSYSITTKQQITQYLEKRKTFNQEMAVYQKKVRDFNEKKIATYPEGYPISPERPSLRFTKQEATTNRNLFDTYDVAIPQVCGMDAYTLLSKNISDSDLEKIGTENSFDIYTLRDKKHLLYSLAYDNKIVINDEEFKQINKDKKKPSLDEYVQQNPLIFLKDYWNRWTMLGEYDYKVMGGCGKPVLYFYPEKITDIHVNFAQPVSLTFSIPQYADGWHIRAYPDGALTDLQPNKTICSFYDGLKKGSEYAKNACQQNKYPYIYWEGNRVGKQYPQLQEGWIVEKENIREFINEKLDAVGLNQKEKSDMLEYWVPEMLSKNSPYYRIGFFQTNDMNNFIPMHIVPNPDTIFRLFLDYQLLQSKPDILPVPQDLQKLHRNGFTVVEWGGLKLPMN